jgi:hypothetical protein
MLLIAQTAYCVYIVKVTEDDMPKVKGLYFPIVNFKYHAEMMKE